MLDNYQFTLLIVAVGIGAYLASVQQWHMDRVTARAEQIAALEAKAQAHPKPITTEKAAELGAQKLGARAELEYLRERLSYLGKSVLLLIGFLWLLVLRIVVWSWRTGGSSMANPEGAGSLWLDRTVVLLLAALILWVTGFHLVQDIPVMFKS